MKRLLSLILALSLVISLMPAIFAEEGGEATQQDAGITITYNVTKNFGAWNKQAVQFADFTYESNNGLWEYYGNTNGLPTIDNSVTMNWSGTTGMQMRSGWWAIKIIVPKSGVYTPKVEYRAYKEAAMLDLYLLQADHALSEADLNPDNFIGGIDCYDPQYQISPTVQEPKALDPIYIEAGEYYFVYRNGEKTSPSGTGWAFFGNLILDGNGTDTVLTSIITSKVMAVCNGQSRDIKSRLYLSDGSYASSGYTLTYKSSDNNVATVDANGKVTGVGLGDAIITVSATSEVGYTAKAEIKVSVADGAKLVYNFPKDMVALGMKYQADKTAYPLTLLSKPATKGYSLHSYSDAYDDSKIRYGGIGMQLRRNVWVAFELDIPVAGVYAVTMKAASGNNTRMNTNVNVYFSKGEASTSNADLIGYFNPYDTSLPVSTTVDHIIGDVEVKEPGKYIINVKNSGYYYNEAYELTYNSTDVYSTFGAFVLSSGDKKALYEAEITSSTSSINVDEGETAEVVATGYLSSTTEAATFTYSSSNTAVATVDPESGVVTPVAEGVAKIIATSNADLANTLTTEIEVTCNKPGEAIADTKVNFMASAEEGGTVTDNKLVKEVTIGSNVTVEATANDGYEFAYWRNASGKHLSSNAKETFKVNTNTSVIAVFDKVEVEETDTEVPVYFYNENGSLIEKKNVTLGSTFSSAANGIETSLTGFKFREWSVSGDTIINKILRAVALYDKNETEYNVTVGGVSVASGKYGDKVTVTGSDSFKAWKLGENIVSYDKEYSFYIWGNVALTEVTEGEVTVAPTVAISNNGESYFISYNVPTGYTLIEAGIVFAKSGSPEIGSFNSKAIAKMGTGQFTAKKGEDAETVARGYVMFKDSDDSIRVIYAD